MNSIMKLASILVLSFAILDVCESTSKRHVIYWNSFASPELVSDEIVTHVEIGEFMDILCPQNSLRGITDSRRELSTFDLYNVTGSEYDQCHTNDRRKFIFSCDRPERENKLTLKFQIISPSPLGFRFQYCQDYYIIALQRGKRSTGCYKESTRLHIRVGCKEPETTTTVATTTTTTTTEDIMKPVVSLLDRLKIETTRRNNMQTPEPTEELSFPRNDVIIPNVVAPSRGVPRVLESGDSGSSKATLNSMMVFLSVLVCFLTQVRS